MISVLTFSEVGGHRLNEDALAVEQHTVDPNCWLCFIADGQGGQSGGGPAAQLACKVAMEVARDLSPEKLQDRSQWSRLLQVVDDSVCADSTAGYATFVGLCVFRGRIVGVSSGDSAALTSDWR